MRIRKLIDPPLQLKLTLWFACTVLVGLLFQFVLVSRQLSALALRLPGDPSRHHELLTAVALNTLWISVLVILPLTVAVGVLTTFKIVGPLHSIRLFLRQIIAGDKPARCTLRKGDDLQDICELLNEATDPLRRQEVEEDATPLRRVA